MFYFLKGKVELVKQSSIVLNVHDIGYQILVSHPSSYIVGTNITLYTYNVIKEDTNYLIGFSSLEEKYIFLSLIKINGLGPKSVITALTKTTPSEIKNAIASNNIAYLKKLPGIGEKAAYHILLNVKKDFIEQNKDTDRYLRVMEALKSLGFKKAAIERALASINDPSLDEEGIIKKALIILGR